MDTLRGLHKSALSPGLPGESGKWKVRRLFCCVGPGMVDCSVPCATVVCKHLVWKGRDGGGIGDGVSGSNGSDDAQW